MYNLHLQKKYKTATPIRCYDWMTHKSLAKRCLALKVRSHLAVQQLLSASRFRLCFSMYRFLAFSINSFFRSWNDKLLSCADFPKVDAAFARRMLGGFDVVAEDCDGLPDVDGRFFDCWDSGMYRKWPSRMLEMVWSTFFVFTEKRVHRIMLCFCEKVLGSSKTVKSFAWNFYKVIDLVR